MPGWCLGARLTTSHRHLVKPCSVQIPHVRLFRDRLDSGALVRRALSNGISRQAASWPSRDKLDKTRLSNKAARSFRRHTDSPQSSHRRHWLSQGRESRRDQTIVCGMIVSLWSSSVVVVQSNFSLLPWMLIALRVYGVVAPVLGEPGSTFTSRLLEENVAF